MVPHRGRRSPSGGALQVAAWRRRCCSSTPATGSSSSPRRRTRSTSSRRSALLFAAYCWTFVDSPRWRAVAAAVLALNIVLPCRPGVAAGTGDVRSIRTVRSLPPRFALKQPEMFGHRRPFAIDGGPTHLQDPSRPYHDHRDVESGAAADERARTRRAVEADAGKHEHARRLSRRPVSHALPRRARATDRRAGRLHQGCLSTGGDRLARSERRIPAERLLVGDDRGAALRSAAADSLTLAFRRAPRADHRG